MAKNILRECSSCGYEIPAKGKVICPSCGAVNKKPVYKRAWFIVLAAIFVLGILGNIGSSDDEITSSQNETDIEAVDNLVNVEEERPMETAINETSIEKEPEVKNDISVEETSSETVSQRNALRSAKNYLNFTAFSRDGLIKQLKFEGFELGDATYGVDNSGADWMEQAVKSAKNYLQFTAFSRSGLIQQLEFEGFTNEQAVFGVDNSGADWMEQAVKSAKNYLQFTAFSRSGLIQQLEFEGFTNEQAVHGVNATGL